MKIAVAIKQVPARDSTFQLDASGCRVREDDLDFEISEPDAYALEAALQLKEKHGGEVVALCAGPARAAQAIREALAKGAERAIHIEEDLSGWDPLSLSRLLARAIEPEKPDLILTGLQSDDLGYGQTGVLLAELMRLPHATIVVDVEMREGAVRVKRELEGGWFQHVELPLPALLSIQSGIRQLRYATLMGIKRAKTKEIRTLHAADLGMEASIGVEAVRLYPPRGAKQAEILKGSAQEAAAQLVERLRFGARVL